MRELRWKESFLVTWKILRLFVNTATADDKYAVLRRDNLKEPIQMHLSEKQKKICSNVLCAFFKSTSNFEHFQTKMNLIAYVFATLWTLKDVVK